MDSRLTEFTVEVQKASPNEVMEAVCLWEADKLTPEARLRRFTRAVQDNFKMVRSKIIRLERADILVVPW